MGIFKRIRARRKKRKESKKPRVKPKAIPSKMPVIMKKKGEVLRKPISPEHDKPVFKQKKGLGFRIAKGIGKMTGTTNLASRVIEKLKIGTEEQRADARKQFGEKIDKPLYKDPALYKYLGTAAIGGIGAVAGKAIVGKIGFKALTKFAPRMTRFTTSPMATITKTAYQGKKAISVPFYKTFKVSKITMSNGLRKLIGYSKPQLKDVVKNGFKLLSKHKGKAAIATGLHGMMTWFAADNILQGASIFSRDVSTNVRFGNLTREEALEGLDQAQSDVNYARKFINISVSVNPLLWIFGKLLKTGVNATQRNLDLQRRLI